jgi:hypothetical protein
MTLSEILSALKRRRLDIDCTEITLVQNTEAEAISFKGPGHIRQGEDDQIGFKIYAVETANTDPLRDLNRISHETAGTLYRDSDYYSLSAAGVDGRKWTVDRILPRLLWPAGSGNPIVTGKIASMAADCSAGESGPSLVLHYFGDTQIPSIEDQYSFRAADCEFTIRKGDAEFIVEARGPGALANHFHVRIQEALRLLLAQSVDWRVLLRHEGGRQRLELASGIQRPHRAQLGRPVDGDYGCIEDCWRLFGKYLEYVLATVPTSSWNRCSYYLYNACEASTGSVDAWAIGVSVAVEGIANLIKGEVPAEEKTKLADLMKLVLAHISAQPCLAGFADRVKGLLGTMQNMRPQDRLWPPIEQGYVNQEYLRAWSKLRNKHVHPGELGLGDTTITDYHQKLLGLINKTTVLMYWIIFYLIGYKGKFIDYGVPDYPYKEYPDGLLVARKEQ